MKTTFQNFILVLKTLSYLNFTQLVFQVYYRLKIYLLGYGGPIKKSSTPLKTSWKDFLYNKKSYLGNNKFIFLNKKKFFTEINWNFSEFKDLWIYNLNYFDFLNQKEILKNDGIVLIKNYIRNYNNIRVGKEPYPTSLRIINWIKFISKYRIFDEHIHDIIYTDTFRLNNNIEYHIQGNHLLENAFALFFSGIFFNNQYLIKKSSRLLRKEIKIQILKDGSHFELSPMYHNIILRKILDCIHFIKLNNLKIDIHPLLQNTASKMLGFIKTLSYKNGDYPMFNDSADSIGFKYKDLKNYATKIGVQEEDIVLSECGYRKWDFNNLEIRMDIGKIGPNFLTAHSHADTFNFELIYTGNKIIVDPGISTYHNIESRQLERSTKFHNTINVNSQNSSQVWSLFRTANRAKVKIIEDNQEKISVTHNGYKKCVTKRKFLNNGYEFMITDEIISNRKNYVESNIHFYPGLKITLVDDKILSKNFEITLNGYKNPKLCTYYCPNGYNKFKESFKLVSEVEKKSNILFKFLKE